MKDVAEEIEDKIRKGKMIRTYDIAEPILFQNRTKSRRGTKIKGMNY